MKVSIPGFIHAQPASSYHEGQANVVDGFVFDFWVWDELGQGHVLVCPHTLEFEIPEGWDARPSLIASLKEKERELMAAHENALNAIRAQINKLQAIEMSPAEHEAEQQV